MMPGNEEEQRDLSVVGDNVDVVMDAEHPGMATIIERDQQGAVVRSAYVPVFTPKQAEDIGLDESIEHASNSPFDEPDPTEEADLVGESD